MGAMRRMYETFEDLDKSYAKLIFSANKIPETDDKSYAYYRRWLILAFEKVFEDEAKDIKLIEKLTAPEELSGLLNLALIALKQLRKDNGFKDVSVEKVRKEYEEKSNIVKAFLEANCKIDMEAPEWYTLLTDHDHNFTLDLWLSSCLLLVYQGFTYTHTTHTSHLQNDVFN
jgi:phage/plasmid-associated DNA primase